MKTIIKTVNNQGIDEIRQFLADNHKKGDNFTRDMLLAWANEAEFSLSEGNDAVIEIKSWDSIRGRTQTYTISAAGLDCVEIEING